MLPSGKVVVVGRFSVKTTMGATTLAAKGSFDGYVWALTPK